MSLRKKISADLEYLYDETKRVVPPIAKEVGGFLGGIGNAFLIAAALGFIVLVVSVFVEWWRTPTHPDALIEAAYRVCYERDKIPAVHVDQFIQIANSPSTSQEQKRVNLENLMSRNNLTVSQACASAMAKANAMARVQQP